VNETEKLFASCWETTTKQTQTIKEDMKYFERELPKPVKLKPVLLSLLPFAQA